ncbi:OCTICOSAPEPTIDE/PHOX/BEM1P [Salix purpurea]|uniref:OCTICOSAPEPTIDE/PHOX/BEM1P n=1 Tax=Salix purpurea TaxID=77065 RepID=A0A9Q1ADK7_SALPP|nr:OCTICOSAPEPTIDE/PHOX/BEM1P [Salix purpurea]
MSSLHPSEMESVATDSVASSPRSDYHSSHDPRVRFMCSFGGKILPRPHDNQLRYAGGDTRIVAVHRSTTFSTLITKLSKLSGIVNLSVKYQLPNEDLDALISVTTDEDVDNMMDEYDRVSHNQNPRSARLRLFLFSTANEESSRASSISSLLDGSTNRENWFFDALNSGARRLERGRSEVSSIISEVPDYLFGLENSDETKHKPRFVMNDNVSASDPGSPAPVVSSPYCSTSSAVPTVPSILELPLIKTKPDNPDPVTVQGRQTPVQGYSEQIETPPMTQPTGYPGNPVMHYIPDSCYSGGPVQQMPVYYVQGTIPPGNVQIRSPYVQQFPIATGQMPVRYHQAVQGMGQVYNGMTMRPVAAMDPYDGARMVSDGMNQQVYYGVRNASTGMVQGYSGMVMPGGDDLKRTASGVNLGRVSP